MRLVPLILLLLAIACAVWVVLLLGPFTDWPGNAEQLVAACLAFFAASFLPWRES